MLAANASARDGDKQQRIYTPRGKYKSQRKHSRPTGEFKEKQDKQVTAMSLENSRTLRTSKSAMSLESSRTRRTSKSAMSLESSRTLSTSKSAMSLESSRTRRTSKSAMSLESSKTSRHSDIIGEFKDKEVTAISHQNLSGNKPSSDTCADFV